MREEDSRHQFIQLISFKVVCCTPFETVNVLDLNMSRVKLLSYTLIQRVFIDPLTLELNTIVVSQSSLRNRLPDLDVEW